MSEPGDRVQAGTPDAATALGAHVAGCEECRAAPPPLDRITTVLGASVAAVDAAGLSQRTLSYLQPALARRAMAGLWRTMAAALLFALAPLPAVLAYDAYVLRVVYQLVSVLVPATVAVYVISVYAAFLVLLFAATYAAIPLFLAKRTPSRAALV